MSLRVKCPGCGASYSVEEKKLGSRVKCKCGQSFTLMDSVDESHARSQPGKSSDETELPKEIGQYVVLRRLGAGAMGEVYLAHDPKLQRDVAIKVLPTEFSTDKERLHRFLREARSSAGIHHTNAATVYEVGTEGNLTFIAMEYINGGPLDEAIADAGAMPWRDATRIIRDAAAGLAAAHEIGLVHRDIKPANLMRTAAGVTKVVDFGLARAQHGQTELTRAGTLLGTPAYMAPEQWAAGAIDGRSDLYSLTVTYYTLLTGQPPFVGADVPALGYLHRYEPLPDPRQHVPDLADDVCRILARGSAKEPAERYQNGAELIADLDALLALPDESLTSTSSWQDLAGISATKEATIREPNTPATKSASSVTDDKRPDALNPNQENHRKQPTFLKSYWLSLPLFGNWLVGAGAAALLILLCVVLFIQTEGGQETSNSTASDDDNSSLLSMAGPANSGQDVGWTPLSSGRDLSGWEVFNSRTIDWKIEDGTITGENRSDQVNSGGSIFTQSKYKDFHFRCEILAGPPHKGMLLFRNNQRKGRGARRGYLVRNSSPDSVAASEGWGIGSLYADDFQVLPDKTRLVPGTEKDLGIKPGDWYQLEIVALGEAIEVWINGKKTAGYSSPDPRLSGAGSIGLSCPRGVNLACRNLEIRELNTP